MSLYKITWNRRTFKINSPKTAGFTKIKRIFHSRFCTIVFPGNNTELMNVYLVVYYNCDTYFLCTSSESSVWTLRYSSANCKKKKINSCKSSILCGTYKCKIIFKTGITFVWIVVTSFNILIHTANRVKWTNHF